MSKKVVDEYYKETTEEDFKEFQEECLYWQKELGLTDWLLYFRMKNLGDSQGQFDLNFEGRCATITIGTKIFSSVKRIALHEMIEGLLLGGIRPILFNREARFTEEEIREEIHAVVRRLENYLTRK